MIGEIINVIRGKESVVPEEDKILRHYRGVTRKTLKPLRPLNGETLSTVCQGLGDTMMLTDLPAAAAKQNLVRTVFSPSTHFLQLMSFNPYYKDIEDKAYLLNAPDLIRQYDCGNGHYLQRIRRAFGVQVDDRPKGFLKWSGNRYRQRVIMHFDPGVHVRWQRKKIHPKARMIYPETQRALKEFIASKSGWEFIEVGNQPIRIAGARCHATQTTVELVNLVASAQWFIGIMSGPMHVATALGLNCVVIVNFPKPDQIFLPTLVTTGQIEEEWFYPQNIHLHQEGDGALVKKSTLDNLKRAFNGEVYPYFSDKYLPLIHEIL